MIWGLLCTLWEFIQSTRQVYKLKNDLKFDQHISTENFIFKLPRQKSVEKWPLDKLLFQDLGVCINPLTPVPAVTGRAKTHPQFPVPAVKRDVRTIASPTLPKVILVLLLFYCC